MEQVSSVVGNAADIGSSAGNASEHSYTNSQAEQEELHRVLRIALATGLPGARFNNSDIVPREPPLLETCAARNSQTQVLTTNLPPFFQV